MSKQKSNTLTKKEAKIQISQALASLNVLQSAIGGKKYQRRLEKVETILSKGLPKQIKKDTGKKENTAPAA